MKITTPRSRFGKPVAGQGSRFTCDDVDISSMVRDAVIRIAVDSIVTADVSIYVHDVSVEGAQLSINGVQAPPEVMDALREFFRAELEQERG